VLVEWLKVKALSSNSSTTKKKKKKRKKERKEGNEKPLCLEIWKTRKT
jgi:hypothetical protein